MLGVSRNKLGTQKPPQTAYETYLHIFFFDQRKKRIKIGHTFSL